MKSKNFATIQELKDFLDTTNYQDTSFFIEPDYIQSVVGISCNGRVLYSYDLMVENLYLEYMEDDTISDPYQAAMEWIDYNIGHCGGKSPLIVYTLPDEGLNDLFGISDIDEMLNPFLNYCIGLDYNDTLLFDDDLCDDDKKVIQSITDTFANINVEYV